jgi:hypothetical protein
MALNRLKEWSEKLAFGGIKKRGLLANQLIFRYFSIFGDYKWHSSKYKIGIGMPK